MSFAIRLLFLAIILISPVVYAEEVAKSAENPAEEEKLLKIIALGDSLMTGQGLSSYRDFPSTLARQLFIRDLQNYNIINRSKELQTTADALKQLRDIINEKPDAVILELGVDDVRKNVPLADIYKNLVTIITTLQQQQITILLIGTEPPAGSAEEYDGKFVGMYKYLANQYKVPLHADFQKGVAGDPSLNLADGFHPNQMGVEKMVEGAMPVVLKMIKYLQAKVAAKSAEAK
jgi:acyl-CoA thioesterase-1